MSLNEKIMKSAMNSALSSFNEQIPMFKSAIDLYGEPKTKESENFKLIMTDLVELIDGIQKLPISADNLKILIGFMAINIDVNPDINSKAKKLFSDLKKALNEY
jgi:hypothetical protein